MKKGIVCLCLFLFSVFSFGISISSSKVFATSSDGEILIKAKAALLIECETGEVIFEKNANDRLPIASMTKIATLSLVFDALNKGIIKENDLVTVSSNAASTGGSTAFLDAGSKYKLCDLIKSVVIASANDSSVALAEYVAGSEDLFVQKMNKFVNGLELKNTHFENCTGLPHENHYSSAFDIAKIYKTICGSELYKKYSKVWMDELVHPSGRKTELVNTNRLVRTYDGIEGGKTGYTDAAKFCLTASAKRGDLRLIGVVIGEENSKVRFFEMSKLFNYGFSNYQNKVIAKSDVPVTVARFFKSKNHVLIYPKNDCVKFVKKDEGAEFTTDFKVNDITAPIKGGTVVGKLYVFDQNNMVVDEVDLIVKETVDSIGFKESFGKLIHCW